MISMAEPFPPERQHEQQAERPGADCIRWASRRAYLLLLPVILLGFGLYVLTPPSSAKVQVKGRLSTEDVRAIGQELRRNHWAQVRFSIAHCRLSSLWDQVSVVGSCPLTTIESVDDTTAVASFRGRSWGGDNVTIQSILKKTGNEWSLTSLTRSQTAAARK